MLDDIKTESSKVRDFGEKKNFERLTKRKWYADEVDGWEMKSVMAYLLNARGAYKMPDEKVFSFVIFTKIERME